jgi:NAD-dependent SIR2 family protein deacetylase
VEFNLVSTDCVVLLGAGASVEAGLPTSNQLTRLALQETDGETDEKTLFRMLYGFVAGSILFMESKNGRNPLDVSISVEEIAEALSALDSFDRWKYSKLFLGMDPSLEELRLKHASLFRLRGLRKALEEFSNADAAIKRRATEALSRQIVEGGFIYPSFYKQAFYNLLELCFNQLKAPTKPLDYLVPLARNGNVRCVATLNFDTLFEQTCALANRAYDVGVFEWTRGDLVFFDGVLPVLKLHGSVDWVKEFGSEQREDDDRPIGPERITRGTPVHGWLSPRPACVLFGTRSKLEASGPFLDLLHRFESDLSQVSRVAVIGYSFADDHINSVLSAWVDRSPNNQLAIANGRDFLSSAEHRSIFYQSWNPDQVSDSGMLASEAIRAWCTG